MPHDDHAADTAPMPAVRSTAMRWVLTIAFIALAVAVVVGLNFLSAIAPTLRANHKGYGRAVCTVCHPPAKTHAGMGYTPDSCAECHGSNGAKRTTDKHAGWKRADCFASGCHAAATTHAGAGFMLAGCAPCHGANGLPTTKP